MKHHAVFDIELIGDERPVMLVCVHIIELRKRAAFWWHRPGDMERLRKVVENTAFTWVSFNGYRFDVPILSAVLAGMTPIELKEVAAHLIEHEMMPWQVEQTFGYTTLQFDHIDLFHTAPGVKISLKRYMARMGYKTLVDMPFHHTTDLSEAQLPTVESYCFNDVGGTGELLGRLTTEIALRERMGEEYGLDLRSKSDAQIAEAIFKKRLGIKKNSGVIPPFVEYRAPALIQTDHPALLDLIDKFENERFVINRNNGRPVKAAWMRAEDDEGGECGEGFQIGRGTYTVGLGGLHSTHDVKCYVEAGRGRCVSDFDVASYYPNIIMKVGLIPDFGGLKGEQFIDEYEAIYNRRMEAKRAGNKQVANSLKIVLNGTFGKLGERFSILYAPQLLIATTITGQLNLLCLIAELEKLPDVRVVSANTDGIMVDYPETQREAVLAVISANAVRTGFEYEETRYARVAMKDVNNYIAITADGEAAIITPDGAIEMQFAKGGKAKRKGLYASTNPKENPLYLMKNPTMEVCANLAVDYLREGVRPEDAITRYSDMRDYVAVREVKGGGVQYEGYRLIDDWVPVMDGYWKRQAWLDHELPRAAQKRKSRPKPVAVGYGGIQFGKVARWYMTTESMPPLSYVGSGNTVAKTEGGRLCMTLPDRLPDDLDIEWYLDETYAILNNLGVALSRQNVTTCA